MAAHRRNRLGKAFDQKKAEKFSSCCFVHFRAFVKVLEADMKEEKKTNLAAFIGETDRVPEGGIQVRNEKITGDEGTAEVKGGVYLNWTALGFVKEGGVWKFSNKIPDVQAVDQSKGK